MLKLPFLKNRLPRQETEPMSSKMVHGSAQDLLEHHVATEMMDAVSRKDIKTFRSSVEALVLSMFDYDGDDDDE